MIDVSELSLKDAYKKVQENPDEVGIFITEFEQEIDYKEVVNEMPFGKLITCLNYIEQEDYDKVLEVIFGITKASGLDVFVLCKVMEAINDVWGEYQKFCDNYKTSPSEAMKKVDYFLHERIWGLMNLIDLLAGGDVLKWEMVENLKTYIAITKLEMLATDSYRQFKLQEELSRKK